MQCRICCRMESKSKLKSMELACSLYDPNKNANDKILFMLEMHIGLCGLTISQKQTKQTPGL
jgi:hypothetical protein